MEQLRAGDQIRPGEYHQRFAADVTDRQARRDLVELADAGFLLRIGKGSGTIYRRKDRT
jgi:DeoR/GlpR family transcriptional regulator of sugar metabolism